MPDARPNIVVILSDEQHIDTLGCSDSELPVQTPHIDRLARREVDHFKARPGHELGNDDVFTALRRLGW